MSLIVNHLFKRRTCLSICKIKAAAAPDQSSSNPQLILNSAKSLCPLVQNVDRRSAGHSKWQNIRHTKAAKDSLKSKLYSKISISITRAALRGIDPKYNKELSNVLELAKRSNVSRDLIDRAMKRAETQQLKSVPKGFYGPNNVVGIANFLFDPRLTRPSNFLKPINKTYKDFRFVDPGSMLNFFEKKGVLYVSKYDRNSQPVPFEKIEEAAIESEAEEVVITCEEDKIVPPLEVPEEKDAKDKRSSKEQPVEEESELLDPSTHWKLLVSDEALMQAKSLIEKSYPDLVIQSYSIEYIAREAITLPDKDLETFHRFCQDLSEMEEFENVYSNVNS